MVVGTLVAYSSSFIHKNRSHNCDTGWVLCHISMAFNWIPFKLQKGTPTIVTPSTQQISAHSFKRLTLWA